MRAVFDSAADGILTVGECGEVASINPAAEAIFGYAASEVAGKTLRQVIPAFLLNDHESYLGRLLETGQTRLVGVWREFEGVRKDGIAVQIELLMVEVVVDKSSTFAALLREITASKPPEDERPRFADEEERDRSARSFLVDLSRSLAEEEPWPDLAVASPAGAPSSDPDSPEEGDQEQMENEIRQRPAEGILKDVWRSVRALLHETPDEPGHRRDRPITDRTRRRKGSRS